MELDTFGGSLDDTADWVCTYNGFHNTYVYQPHLFCREQQEIQKVAI